MTRPAIAAILAVVLLAGCASLPAPKTPDQTVLAAYGLYLTVSRSTADSLEAEAISRDQAERIRDKLADVRPLLDDAQAAVKGGQTPSGRTLAIIRAIQQQLLAMQSRLQQEHRS